MNSKVDSYFAKAKKWRREMETLRTIVLECSLTEELKWGKPCYTFQEKNVVLIVGFKEYCSLLFTKGSLLKDAHGILVLPGENTQAARQIRFTDMDQIIKLEPILKEYLREAVAVEKAGLEVILKKITEYKLPEELQKKLNENPGLQRAFRSLTPGRQRAYLMHIAAAKQSTTREARVEKCMPLILDGKGLND